MGDNNYLIGGRKDKKMGRVETTINTYPDISMKRYRQYKLKLRNLERVNCDTVMMIPCAGSKNWHELAEHSALIYYYEVCSKLRRKIKFYADTLSLYDQYKIGYIRSLGVETIRENLKKVELYKSESKEGDLIVFQLKTRFSRKRFQEMYEMEMARRQENLAPEPTGLLSPKLYQILVQLSRHLHSLCNQHLDKLSSQTNGADIIRLIDGTLELYYQVAMMSVKPVPKIIEKYTEMRKAIYALMVKIRVLGEISLWDPELCSKITEPLAQARDLVEQELRKLLKENRKKGDKRQDKDGNATSKDKIRQDGAKEQDETGQSR